MPTKLTLTAEDPERNPISAFVSLDVTDERLHDVELLRAAVRGMLDALITEFVPELEHMTLRGHLRAAGLDPDMFRGERGVLK